MNENNKVKRIIILASVTYLLVIQCIKNVTLQVQAEKTEPIQDEVMETVEFEYIEKPIQSSEYIVSIEGVLEELEEEEPEQITKIVYVTDNLNVHSDADIESTVVATVEENTVITVSCAEGDDWSYSDYYDGYLYNDYLSEYNEVDYCDIELGFKYQDLIKEMLDVYELDIDEYFVLGLMWVENRFGNDAESSAGAKGIMQIMPKTWSSSYNKFLQEYPEYSDMVTDDRTDVQSNIIIGMYILKCLAVESGDSSLSSNSYDRVLTSYNMGSGGAYEHYNSYGTWSSGYSRSVLAAAEELRTTNTIN